MAIQDFDATTGDAIAQLDVQTLRAGFERLLQDFSELARMRAELPVAWPPGGLPK